MKSIKTLKLCIAVLIIAMVGVSCGDDPASSNNGEPPEIPEMENIQPDISYFEDNNPQKSVANTENFYEARNFAISLSYLSLSTQFYTSFFTGASQEEANFQDGAWVWDYSYSYEGVSFSMVLTAQESGDFINWDMTYSYNDGQNGVEDYTIIEGRTAKDGTEGTWTFNSMDETNQEVPAMISEWSSESETEVSISSEFYTDGEVSETYTYERNGNEFSLSLTGFDTENDILVIWNTDTMTGYYQLGNDDPFCWDENFQNVSCS